MWTVSQVISEVQRRMPDVTTSQCTTWINLIHRQILSEIPELRMDSVSVNITSGTQEYSIAEPVFQVREAEYVTGAGASTKLSGMTLEELDQQMPGWRNAATGTPQYFYLGSNQASGNSEVIGLVPAPNATTSTYPYVLLQVSEIEASDLTTSSVLPPTIPNARAYIEGVSELAAVQVRQQMAMMYNSTFEAEVQRIKEYVQSRNADLQRGNRPMNPRRAKS